MNDLYSIDEDNLLSITAPGVLVNDSTQAGTTLTAILITPPAHAITFTLNGDGSFLYSPIANYNGPDSFTYIANNSEFDSNNATVSIIVSPVNDAPFAVSKSYITGEDTPIPITLAGSDIENDPLTYSVVMLPAHGNLSGIAPNLIYTPAANYTGPDSFTYTANDGKVDSDPAIVSIMVIPVNDPPVAISESYTTAEDTPVAITLTFLDPDTDEVFNYSYSSPGFGALSGTAPDLTYAPLANYHGPDLFTFIVNDGYFDSNTATIFINVTPVNDPPVAVAESYNTIKNVSIAIDLAGYDVDGDSLTFTVVTQPTNGTLSGTPPDLTYVPDTNYVGPDSFTYKVNDGTVDSNIATVSIDVSAEGVNHAPVANSTGVSTPEDRSLTINLTGSDADIGDVLTYIVVKSPEFGTLSGSAPNLNYTPWTNYYGPDFFTFIVNDGHVNSNPATIFINVTPVNDPPVAVADSFNTTKDRSIAVILAGYDVDGDSLTFTVVTQPTNGTLSGTPPDLTYVPDTNYVGPDSFTYKVNDGTVDSNIATVSITVRPPPELEITTPCEPTATYGVPYSCTFTATSPSGPLSPEDVTFTLVGLPPGVSFDPVTNTISGNPLEVGTFPVSGTATYGRVTVPLSFQVTVNPQPPAGGGGGAQGPGGQEEQGQIPAGPQVECPNCQVLPDPAEPSKGWSPIVSGRSKAGSVNCRFHFSLGNCPLDMGFNARILDPDTAEFKEKAEKMAQVARDNNLDVTDVPLVVDVFKTCAVTDVAWYIAINASYVQREGIENLWFPHCLDDGVTCELLRGTIFRHDDGRGNMILEVRFKELSVLGMVSAKAKAVAQPTPEGAVETLPGATPTPPSASAVTVTGGILAWIVANPLILVVTVAAVVIAAFAVSRRRPVPRIPPVPEEGPGAWERLIEGEKEKAYAAIIDVLNDIDAQLKELGATLTAKGPGYVFPREDAKAVVDKFFFSCQVAERRIKGAAENNHITKEQVAELNAQLKVAVDRMIVTSQQSDVLAQLVQESLGAAAGT